MLMSTRGVRPDLFPIPSDVREEIFDVFAGQNDRTLHSIEAMHIDTLADDGPAAFVLNGTPLRPELQDADRETDRDAYTAGVVVASVLMRAMRRRRGWPEDEKLVVVPDSDPIRRLAELALGGNRFRLQRYFEPEEGAARKDAIQIFRRTLEWYWYQRGVHFMSSENNRSRYAVVGFGDVLAVCAAANDEEFEDVAPMAASVVPGAAA